MISNHINTGIREITVQTNNRKTLGEIWKNLSDRLMAHVYLSGWDGSVAVMRRMAHRRF